MLILPLNMDLDDLKRRIAFPAMSVQQLSLKIKFSNELWDFSSFLDVFFSICHPSYVKIYQDMPFGDKNSIYKYLVKGLMENKTTKRHYWSNLKHVEIINPQGGVAAVGVARWRRGGSGDEWVPKKGGGCGGCDDDIDGGMMMDGVMVAAVGRQPEELELKEKLNVKYAARGKLLEEKDSKILMLKSQLAEKEAEAAEVVRLRDQVSLLSEEKSALTAEVSALKVTITQKDHDISLLDSRATHLESALNNAQVACTEAGTKITSLAPKRDRLVSEVSSLRAGFKDFKEKIEVQQEKQAQELYNRVAELKARVMDVSGRLEREFYPTYLTFLAGRRWLLTHGIQLAILKCLKSSEYQGILGHALGRAVEFGMQEGLEAGHEHGVIGRSLSMVNAYNPEAARASYVDAVKDLEYTSFPLVDLLKSKKDVGMDEVLDCFLLDGPLAGLPEAAYLRPCIEQLSVPIYHAGDKTAVGETSLSFALMIVHARAEGAKKHAAALRQLMMEIVSAPLSSQTWVGEASTSAAPLSVEDYTEEDTDEALGSVVAVPKLECCHF
ncbi:hypothetical protein Tco_0689461 [Tanacetum coccineum]